MDLPELETSRQVLRLECHGTTAWKTRPLHRFIGSALVTRHEVLSVLHLLDKSDETWDDPEIDRIYDHLRAEFDLSDRYRALEIKLGSIQESLELVLDAVRDRRLVLLRGDRRAPDRVRNRPQSREALNHRALPHPAQAEPDCAGSRHASATQQPFLRLEDSARSMHETLH